MDKTHRARFGTLLGTAEGGVGVYSSDYNSAAKEDLPDREAYRSHLDDVFMGYKWQCVELARRWLYVNKGYVFDDIAMAYDIFRLRDVTVIADGAKLPLKSFKNGAKRAPEPGCLLIWNEGGEFDVTGHVAVVTEVTDSFVRVVEQNVEDKVWATAQPWSRELPASRDDEGRYWIDCTYENAGIMGWVIQTDDATHAEEIVDPDPALFDLNLGEIEEPDDGNWLDPDTPEDDAFIQSMEGCCLTEEPGDRGKYLRISETAIRELKRATNELHAMFMHATNYVLKDDKLLRRFNLPEALWPRIHQSWDNRRNEMITGRFDFRVSADGIKVYEYNCDSASCHMETGRVQGRWADRFDHLEGRCPGAPLLEDLTEAWSESELGGTDHLIHIMQDRDLEETYHALFMQRAMTAAGIRSKIIKGLGGLSWGDDGKVHDVEGEPIDWVWKTWAWETALDQIRDQIEDDEEDIRLHRTIDRSTTAPRLVDVLLRPEVMVFEPLWTLIPSNKAILPVLWMLYPNHPYLLETHFELTDGLRDAGYVVKPIVGRCGENISLVDHNDNVLEATDGRFQERDEIYQALAKLPVIDGKNVQVCTFTADSTYAGSCVRVDPSKIITTDSDILPLRIVPDDQL